MNVASISHGKDSIAMLHVIKDILHLPLDRIITVDVWFDENTRAELPPMVEWKDKADEIIYDRWGIKVEHLFATKGGKSQHTSMCSTPSLNEVITSDNHMGFLVNEGLGVTQNSKLTYKDIFYRVYQKGVRGGRYKDFQSASQEETTAQNSRIYGFPMVKGNWCTGELKKQATNFCRGKKVGWCSI